MFSGVEIVVLNVYLYNESCGVYGITNLLKAADRRISVNKSEQYFQNTAAANADICKTILRARRAI